MSNSQMVPSKNAELSKLRQERESLALRIKELDQKIIEAELAANTRLPLLALPTEVTCMIFRFALEHPIQFRKEWDRPEIIVSHVCHQWRSISLSYPHLWTTFSFQGYELLDSPLDRLDAYLERSASQSLELWFDFRDTYIADSDCLTLLETTVPHMERWKRFTLISDGADRLLFTFLDGIETAFAPNLEHFASSCDLSTRDAQIVSIEPGIFTNGAPKLQSVLFDCSSVVCLPPLSNITTLRLEAIDHLTVLLFSWSTFVSVLSLPSIANLSMAGEVFDPPPDFSTTHPITMTNLTHLRCRDCGDSNWLFYLRAPLLRTLIIQDDWLPEGFGDFAEPYTFPSLESVSLVNTQADSPDTWDFARLTASATEVLFFQKYSYENIFSVLQNSEEHSKRTYWTNVKTLTCNVSKVGSQIGIFLQFAKDCPKKNDLVLRIFDHLDVHWRQSHPSEYEALTKLCAIETLDAPLVMEWPPGEYSLIYMSSDDDPFYIH